MTYLLLWMPIFFCQLRGECFLGQIAIRDRPVYILPHLFFRFFIFVHHHFSSWFKCI